jgi:GntR family transcriptional regulator
VIVFHMDTKANVAPYIQLVQQAKHALRLGTLREGDQLPTVREVATQLAINPNTVLRAYRELEHDGVVATRQGVGTFVWHAPVDGSMASYASLRQSLTAWLRAARAGDLDDDSIVALFSTTLAETAQQNAGGETHEEHLA